MCWEEILGKQVLSLCGGQKPQNSGKSSNHSDHTLSNKQHFHLLGQLLAELRKDLVGKGWIQCWDMWALVLAEAQLAGRLGARKSLNFSRHQF